MRGRAAFAEDAQVGGHPLGDPAPVAQAVNVRRAGGQVPGQLLVPGLGAPGEVVPGEPRERAIPTRVRMLALVDPIGSGAVPVVGADPGKLIVGQAGPVQVTADVKVRCGQQIEHPLPRRP